MTFAPALEIRIVGDIVGDFWVPGYQRGYRWGPHEVTLLLDDLEASGGSSYYLQPVVVRPREDGRWELIDGQQRMTTLFLLLRHMERSGLQSLGPSFSLTFETRQDSRRYLLDPATEQCEDNIDFWHIHLADRTIADWFAAKGHRRQVVANDLYGYLFKSVKIIWYVASPELDAVELFTRLNVGRIPFTDAELVKAIILTASEARSQEVAAEWDSMERTLQTPDVWAFASGRSAADPTHMSLVLNAVATASCADCRSGRHGRRERDRPVFHTFEVLRDRVTELGWKPVWDEVVELYSLVLGWFEDRDVFHRIGFLVATGTPLADLVPVAAGSQKSDLLETLRRTIREQLFLTEDDLRSLDYESDRAKCSAALLLLNVETVQRRTSSLERFSFAAHAGHAWSLEHIHAQNAQELTKADQWRSWLDLHAKALAALPGAATEPIRSLLTEIAATSAGISAGKFRDLAERTVLHFAPDGGDVGTDLHGISNLALLSRELNSELSNAVFEAKRAHVVAADRRGDYIPPATRNVFLKYYTRSEDQQVHFWGVQDRMSYLDGIVEVLGTYLLLEEVPS